MRKQCIPGRLSQRLGIEAIAKIALILARAKSQLSIKSNQAISGGLG